MYIKSFLNTKKVLNCGKLCDIIPLMALHHIYERILIMNSEKSLKINCSFCTQNEIDNAIKVIESCYVEETAPDMVKRHFTPGGFGANYGNYWWSLDYALIVDGAKWLDFTYAKDLVDNLLHTQCEDGRVKLYGKDTFAHSCHGPYPDEKRASVPKYFETSYQAAIMSDDNEYIQKAYDLLSKSLEWWFTKRQDEKTKLISAFYEETFIPNNISLPLVYSPMDTNIEVANGCNRCALLAQMLGKSEEYKYYKDKESEIINAVEKYLWCEEEGCFYPYILTKDEHQHTLMSSTFLGYKVKNEEISSKLTDLLLDDSHFNWNTYPLTTVSKKDELFTTIEGKYVGGPCWSGSVWTLTNFAVIQALLADNKTDLARELSLKTVECFRDNYAEFVNPFTRSGEGVLLYGWTAGQFIQIIIEVLFGISYSAKDGVSVNPLIDEDFAIENLSLPNGTTCNISFKDKKANIEICQ